MKATERVKIAFRKLKAHVYFDKTTLPLRDKVVEFEANDDFMNRLNEIEKAVFDLPLETDSSLMRDIITSIDVLSFPKRMYSQNSDGDKNTIISVGKPKETPVVDEVQYFIDMDVRGHILGVLWLMVFGKRLDDCCLENIRGNRLRTSLIWSGETNGEVLNSPALFEPYFAQYSLWRDEGLSCAEKMLNNKQDALIITLDLRKFYYRTGITKAKFNQILNSEDSEKDKALHWALFSILQRYTEILEEKSIEHSGIVLPIGFLPSGVLSNWCLSKFDKGILDFWNPAYYGRYVDDIIIVEKIERKSEIFDKARNGILTKDCVIDYYLGNARWNIEACFVNEDRKGHARFVESQTNSTNENNSCTKEPCNTEITYRVVEPFCLSEDSLYEFGSKKTRVIALFSDNNSSALINKFKKEILENISEFRLMPEVGEAFSKDDFSEFYRLENDATINKLRGVSNIHMDKYELSKFLGKYRVVSNLVDDISTKRFTRTIRKMFNDLELIENYTLWERVFEIFITDRDYLGFSKFAERLLTSINAIDVTKAGIDVELLKRSLCRHFIATLNRVLSLLWGKNATEALKSINEAKIETQLRNSYLSTYMSNKYIMAVPLEILPCPTNNDNINLTIFSDGFKLICSNTAKKYSHYDLLPYFRQAQDIAFARFLCSFCNHGVQQLDTCEESPYTYKEYMDKVIKELPKAPVNRDELSNLFDDSFLSNNYVLNVGVQKADKLKIAIANVRVSDVWNLENALKGKKPNRKYLRYRMLTDLMNSAIKGNANMLVLPENYVPIEWLPAMATKAARENMAVITGVEHIIVGMNKKIYNYTAVVLPFRYYDTIPTAAVFYQLKKHYSPEEKRVIEGYGFEVVEGQEKRPLYRWKGCYFPVYCCYELAAIHDRAEFLSLADLVVAVEHNKDINYFGSIIESLSIDLHCYCVQVNSSEYGDSRITQPTRRDSQNILTVKGGSNPTLLIGEIDVKSLREFQLKKYALQKSGVFKPTPPGINDSIVRKKIEQEFS